MCTFAKRITALTAILALVASCTSSSKPVTKDIHTIIGIAALHEVVALGYRGLISTYTETVPVDWNMNDAARAILDGELDRDYTVRDFHLEPAEIQRLLAGSSSNSKATEFQELSQRLRSVVQPGRADAIVVIGGTFAGNAFVGHKAPQPTSVGIIYDVTVFDGNTFDLLGSGFSDARSDHRELGIQWNGEPFTTLSDAEKTDIRTLALSTLPQSIPASLRQLGILH